MAEKIELYSTRAGDEVTKSTEEMKKDAWQVLADLGITQKTKENAENEKGVASLNYVPRGTGAFVMTVEGASPEAIEAFKEGTAFHRTPEAKAAMSAELEQIRAEKPAPAKETGEKAKDAPKEKAPKEPELPRTSIALYPVAVDASQVKEGQEPAKAASAAMLAASDRAIEELGVKGTVKNSYDMKTGNWVVGGRGLDEAVVKGLEERLADYRTPEAEASWRANAPVKEAKSEAKGPSEGVDVAAAAQAKGAGAER